MSTVQDYYRTRFGNKDNIRRLSMWKILCESFLQKYIRKSDVVLDMGAGYCEFINTIKCRKKIAVDINPDTKEFSNKNVKVVASHALKVPPKYNSTIDVLFMSNFLEHLDSNEEVLAVLEKTYALLRNGGKVIIIQPNIDLVKESYWDFSDHKVALNTRSVKEVLKITGFTVDTFIERFLPYTTKKINLPFGDFLLKIYLIIPPFLRPFAGQSFIVAMKS